MDSVDHRRHRPRLGRRRWSRIRPGLRRWPAADRPLGRPVPTRPAAAHRKLPPAGGSKTDPVDATAAGHAAIASPSLDRYRIDERVREPRVPVDYRSDVNRRRTVAIDELKSHVRIRRMRRSPRLAHRPAHHSQESETTPPIDPHRRAASYTGTPKSTHRTRYSPNRATSPEGDTVAATSQIENVATTA